MTALIISKKFNHDSLIRAGVKTHTLRKARQFSVIAQRNGITCVLEPSGRLKWSVGSRRAVKTSRTGPAIFYIEIVGITEMMLSGDMTDDIALKEGVQRGPDNGPYPNYFYYSDNRKIEGFVRPIYAFESLWNEIHGEGAFQKNARVWGLEFVYSD